jgi:hypothetical protein
MPAKTKPIAVKTRQPGRPSSTASSSSSVATSNLEQNARNSPKLQNDKIGTDVKKEGKLKRPCKTCCLKEAIEGKKYCR